MRDTPQQPIGSGYGAASTASDVVAGIDLAGKTAVITGGHSGTGRETTRALRHAGADVIVLARDRASAVASLGAVDAQVEAMDLCDPASIESFSAAFVAAGRPLHLLVNSAGVAGLPLTRDARGFEMHFATNHLGHVQLTTALLPALRRAGESRVVTVSAWAHSRAPFDFEDPQFERTAYQPAVAYARSKTANILMTVELDRRERGNGVRALSLHPGSIVGTGLNRDVPPQALRAMGLVDDAGRPVIDPESSKKTPEQGAATSVWCATSPALAGAGGVYCQDCDVARLVTKPVIDNPVGSRPLGVAPHAVDRDAAERLWALSERLLA